MASKLKGWLFNLEIDDLGRYREATWSQSFSGSKYWIMDPMPEDVNMIDIVVGLSNAARFRGQTKYFYSVLQHSVLVSEAVEALALQRGWSDKEAKEAAFEGLFHDSPEAYLGDVARPLKRMRAMREYRRVEALWESCIFNRLNINPTKKSRALVKECDQRIVLDEVYAFMEDPDMWPDSGRYLDLEPLGVEVKQKTQKQVIEDFYWRYAELRPLEVLRENSSH